DVVRAFGQLVCGVADTAHSDDHVITGSTRVADPLRDAVDAFGAGHALAAVVLHGAGEIHSSEVAVQFRTQASVRSASVRRRAYALTSAGLRACRSFWPRSQRPCDW